MTKASPVTSSIRMEFLIVFALMIKLARVKRPNERLPANEGREKGDILVLSQRHE